MKFRVPYLLAPLLPWTTSNLLFLFFSKSSEREKSRNLGRGWARVQLWDRLVRTHIYFQPRAPPNDPITERAPSLFPLFLKVGYRVD